MARIAWTPEMSFGVSLLDADHRLLVQIINDRDAAGAVRRETAARGFPPLFLDAC